MSESKSPEAVVLVNSGPNPDGTYDGCFAHFQKGAVEHGAETKIVLYGPAAPELGKYYHCWCLSGFAMICPPIPELKLSRGRRRTS